MESDWTSLDDLIMEKIFKILSVRDRFSASLVCRRWSLCFDLPMVWRKVDINGNWLTKPICNDEGEIHSNRVLDYEQITQCLRRIGHHIYHINIWQLENFASLYQMFVVFESYFNKMHRSSNIRKISFKFPCDQPLDSNPNGIKLFGVGCQLIGSFKKLLQKMPKLCELELVDLVLERYEANSLMDQISIGLSQSLKVLSIINLTTNHCPLQQISMLSNLEILKISPQNIDDSMLCLIATSKLKHLHIVQNENTPKTVMSCTAKAWTHFKRQANKNIHIHLETNFTGNVECDLLIQPEAPIHSITCKNIAADVVNKIIENYSKSLVVFNDQCSTIGDRSLIDMVSGCAKLSTLKVCRPLTSAALLVLAVIGENLQEIWINKSCTIIKYEEWITEFCLNNGIEHRWIQENYASHDAVEYAISKHLSTQWRFLP